MQSLLWCFFSFRGRLNRQEFALAFFFLLAVAYLVGLVLTAIAVPPTNAGRPWSENELLLAQLQAQLPASIFMLWPSLAIQVKRLRDIGYSWLYLVAANLVIFVIMVVAPIAGIAIGFVSMLFLFFAKGKPR